MKRSKKALIGLACALIIGYFIFLNIYLVIPIHSSNNTPINDPNRTKIRFSNGIPIGESCEFYYSPSYVGSAVTPYAIGINNNSTRLVYDITIDYLIWLQSNNGSLIVENYSIKYYDSMPPFSSVYIGKYEIPTLLSEKYLYTIPPNCTYIKTTITDIHGYV